MAKGPTRILCDSCVDLPGELLERHSIARIPMTIHWGSETFRDGVDLPVDGFYQRLRTAKELPTTSQITPPEYLEAFRRLTADGADLVYIGLSSGLSGSIQSARLAAADPALQGRVRVVDSLGASVGLGLMVLRAAELAEAGLPAQAIAEDIEEYRTRMCHVFTLDTLEYAHRGGRVTTVAMAASKLLDVKPILHIDMAGKLVPIDRVRGRRRSLARLFEEMERLGADVEGKRVGVSHADAREEALEMAECFRRKYGAAGVVVGQIGPTIGTHVGPGCVSIFFEGPAGRGAASAK